MMKKTLSTSIAQKQIEQLQAWNETEIKYPKVQTIVDLFEQQVQQTPEHTALSFEGNTLTYQQLNERANQLAHYLMSLQHPSEHRPLIEPDTLVGICVERSLEMVIGLLAILKAGGAYVPLDPEYPTERLRLVLENSQVPILLAQRHLLGRLPVATSSEGTDVSGGYACPICFLDEAPIDTQPKHNPRSDIQADNLAYVLYTSGSTGQPKGVALPHKALVNLLQWQQQTIGLAEPANTLQFTTLNFDVSFQEIFSALTTGSCLVLVAEEIRRDPRRLWHYIAEQQVERLYVPMAMLQYLAEQTTEALSEQLKLRDIITAGEQLRMTPALRRLFGLLPACRLHNHYGPTESHVVTTYSLPEDKSSWVDLPSIGRPISNTRIYILDEQQQLVAPGNSGELCIAGAGLARGYFNQPELTAEKFIEVTLSGVTERIYKTGDLARWLTDGNLEYIGRIDHQVKLRGFRIELGEIETVLNRHPLVKQGILTCQETARTHDKRLVAYILPAENDDLLVQSGETFVDQWEYIYNETYTQLSEQTDLNLNATGWESSYTKQAIPTAEMRVWAESIAVAIQSLQPKEVLEIGCGSGMILARVAPQTDRYWGFDISPVVLQQVEQLKQQRPELGHVELQARAADDFNNIEKGQFDTIAINSVTQHFPHASYLMQVLEQSIAAIKAGGHLFVGDIQHLALQRTFHASIQYFQANDDLSLTLLAQQLVQQQWNDSKMYIDSRLFIALCQTHPRVTGVKILPHRGEVHNEMVRFRYHAVLEIEHPEVSHPEVSWQAWDETLGIEQLRQQLMAQPTLLGLRGVANARLQSETAILEYLDNPPASIKTVGELRQTLATSVFQGLDPEKLWQLGEELGYNVDISWFNMDAKGCFDVLFKRADDASVQLAAFPVPVVDFTHWQDYTSNPLQGQLSEQLIPQLRDHLKAQLPDYMIPAKFVVLDKMPLTPNGKVDRKSLPDPEMLASDSAAQPLNTPSEALLANLWANLLGLDDSSVYGDSHFFHLGGHSLLATQLAACVRTAFQVELPLSVLLEWPQLADLATWIDQQTSREVLPQITPQTAGTPLVMSYDQQAFWLRSQLDQQASVHNMHSIVRLNGTLNVAALRQATLNLLARQSGLRLYFPDAETVAYAAVEDSLKLTDFSGLPSTTQNAALHQLIQQQINTGFDLTHAPLYRLHLVKLTSDSHILLFILHHTLGDGWSMALWEHEWQALYHTEIHQTPVALPDLPIQYTDYAVWQRNYLSGERLSKLENYWLNQLQDATESPQLPTDYPRPEQQQGKGTNYTSNIPPELHRQLQQLAQQQQSTTFMVLFSAFNLLLYRFSGQSDLCIGVPNANRQHAETQNLIGIFLNLLPIRIRLDGQATFGELLAQARQHTLETEANSQLPFAHLLPKLNPKPQHAYNSYFQLMFNWVTTPSHTTANKQANNLHVEPIDKLFDENEQDISNLDIVVTLSPISDGGIDISWLYDKALYKADTIKLLADGYQQLLTQVIQQPDAPLNHYSLQYLQTPLYPLSSPQREIWFDQMLNPDVPLYNIGGYVDISGKIDPQLFEQAVNLLIQKHDNLRLQLTQNRDEDAVPQQTILLPFSYELALQDFSTQTNPEQAAQSWMQQRFVELFNLDSAPLFRYDLIKLADDHYYWLLQYHHLIIDGYGVALINRSLADIYTQLAEDKLPSLERYSYTDFIQNDRAYVESSTLEKNRAYWLAQYADGAPEALLTPRYHVRHAVNNKALIRSDCASIYLTRKFYQQLEQLGKQQGASLFHVLLGALYIYFTRTGQRDDFAIGLPVLNRANQQYKQTAGLFTGVSPQWFRFGQTISFAELVQQIKKILKASYRHQRCPVSEVNRAVKTNQSRHQLFDVNLSFEQHDYDAAFKQHQSHFTALLHGWEKTPLQLFVRDFHATEDVKIDFVYNLTYFNQKDIEGLQTCFKTILQQALTQTQQPISQLSILPQQQIDQLQAWNATQTDYPKDQTIVSLFEQQVEENPENTAVVFEGQSLTYRQLNEKANQLAHYLLEQPALKDAHNPLIALCVERSLEMLIGLLGILKAGGAYVPLDTSYPPARLQYMLDDSAAPLLLTQTQLVLQLPDTKASVICIDDLNLASQATENPLLQRQASDLGYVIYTSGSTGQPKGVYIAHYSVNRLVKETNYIEFSGQHVFLQLAPLAFDASTLEIWGSLLNGSRLVIMPAQRASLNDISHVIQAHQVTTLWLTAGLFHLMVNEQLEGLRGVKQLLAGGDVLNVSDILKVREHFPRCRLINGYGPTENTTFTACCDLSNTSFVNTAPIGKPIANTRIYILDEKHNLLPIGGIGELCIAGDGLARGYLNRPELTAEKFINVKLFGKTERIYKTGDLARWQADGQIEFMGRKDHQIKLRGFRIELGEIESALNQHPSITEALVTLYGTDANKRLVAYLSSGKAVSNKQHVDLINELKSDLKASLPDYMIPSHFIVLEHFPLTPNGKIDRKALPEPDVTSTAKSNQYVPPNNAVEEKIASVWCEVLSQEQISIHDSFFELGGHSLLAMQVHQALKEDYPMLNVVDLFSYPTIRGLADYIEQSQKTTSISPSKQQHSGQRGKKRRAARRIVRQGR